MLFDLRSDPGPELERIHGCPHNTSHDGERRAGGLLSNSPESGHGGVTHDHESPEKPGRFIRHSSAMLTSPPSASFHRRSHSRTNFVRSFITLVAFHGMTS